MGKAFDVEWDDFTGGHFVGARGTGQPMNTWTGDNVICTADEGMLMAAPSWTSSNQIFSIGAAGTLSSPMRASIYNGTYLQDFGVLTALTNTSTLYSVSLSTGTVTSLGALSYQPSVEHATRFGTRWVSTANGNPVVVYNANGGSATYYSAAGSMGGGAWTWGQFVVAATSNGDKLYYSAAGDVTSWPSGNYLTFGETGGSNRILTVVPTNDTLYVLTTGAWWAVTGVLGQTTTIRRLTPTGATGAIYSGVGATTSVLACETVGGIFTYGGGDGEPLTLVSGTQVRPVLHLAADKKITRLARSGYHVLGQQNDEKLWVYSERHHRWRTASLAATNGSGHTAYYQPVEDLEGDAKIAMTVVYRDGSSSSTGYVVSQEAEPTQPTTTSGVFDSATATLAEYRGKDPFRIKKLLVEVDFGQPTTQTGQRSLGAQVLTNSRIGLPARFLRTTSGEVDPLATAPYTADTFTQTWNDATATLRGDRVLLDFDVADGADTFAAAPRIGMRGVKVRRVIMRAETV